MGDLIGLDTRVRWRKDLRNKLRVFRDRIHAAEVLAEDLSKYRDSGAYILAVPKGGIPVGVEISKKLNLKLGPIIVVRLLISEGAMRGFGALSFDGRSFIDRSVVKDLGIDEKEIWFQVRRARERVERLIEVFGDMGYLTHVRNRIAILVDDGVASGHTMLSAVNSLRRFGPSKIVVAVPTGSEMGVRTLIRHVDEIVCPNIRAGIHVREAYDRLGRLSYEEAAEIYRRFRESFPNLSP